MNLGIEFFGGEEVGEKRLKGLESCIIFLVRGKVL